MIKVGILGAHTVAAGELIRILINHPDVMLCVLASEEVAGQRIDDVHRGLTGDTAMRVASTLDLSGLDAIFLCGEPWEARCWMEANVSMLDQDVDDPKRIIDLTGAFRDGSFGMVYGLPEYNRKAMVRGATRASVPSPVAMAVELALFPLAKNMLLQGAVKVAATIASTVGETHSDPGALGSMDVVMSTRLDPIAPIEHRPDTEAFTREIACVLRQIQPTFSSLVTLSLSRDSSVTRGISAVVELPSSLPVSELERRYEEAYDDHNFTYLLSREPVAQDVANTNKCLLHLAYAQNSPDPITATQSLRITAVIDNLLKGSAGTAVHCMNLLFGLSERTGLSLKASAF